MFGSGGEGEKLNLARYYHTIKYLKFSQVFWRLYYRFFKTSTKINIPVLSLRAHENHFLGLIKYPSLINATTLHFLNIARDISTASCWNDPCFEKLWLYNLHYFDCLNAESTPKAWCDLWINRWIDENPVGQGHGWEPYPVSLRIVNWVKWALAGNCVSVKMQHSLVLQISYLTQKLEWHILGNHLFTNAKALIFGGLFFEGIEAHRWLEQGLKIVNLQLPEQILTDGGHFELSPMYQAILLEDMLDLIHLHTLYQKEIPENWPIIVKKMLSWFMTMNHPDGDLSFFNDATFGIAPTLAQLSRYAARLHLTVPINQNTLQHLTHSGYCRLQKNNAVLIADVAAVGPSYLPAHAHADTLSFEFSLGQQRLLVNSGISTYGNNALREQQRSTARHNALVIDNTNSSEVWGAFRVARRAEVLAMDTQVRDESVFLQASHDGYQRLTGKPIHTRSWTLNRNTLQINDGVSGQGNHDVTIYFHFHPSIIVTKMANQSCVLTDHDAKVIATFKANVPFTLATGFFYPGFNVSLSNQTIIISVNGNLPITVLTEIEWI